MDTETVVANYATSKKKIGDILSLQKITLKDIEHLTRIEVECLSDTITDMLNRLKGEEKDDFVDKIDLIVAANSKTQFWEHNHLLIGRAINKLMREYGFMPSKTALAQETGLSRKTIIKHLTNYKTHPEFMAEVEQFKFMAPKILANVFKLAGNGDMKAARLYFEMIGSLNKQRPGTVVNRQNNYMQINNTVLSQETLQSLSTEQLNQIEYIITGSGGKG